MPGDEESVAPPPSQSNGDYEFSIEEHQRQSQRDAKKKNISVAASITRKPSATSSTPDTAYANSPVLRGEGEAAPEPSTLISLTTNADSAHAESAPSALPMTRAGRWMAGPASLSPKSPLQLALDSLSKAPTTESMPSRQRIQLCTEFAKTLKKVEVCEGLVVTVGPRACQCKRCQ